MKTMLSVFCALVLFALLQHAGCVPNFRYLGCGYPRLYRVAPIVEPVHHVHTVAHLRHI